MKKRIVHPIGLDDTGNVPYLSADVIPQHPIPVSILERLLLAFSAAILAASVAMGEPVGGFVASVMLLGVVLLIFFRKDRRERRYWRKKYPHLRWAESENRRMLRWLLLLQFIAWVLVYLSAMTALLYGPQEGLEALISWTGVGVFTLIVVFFLPGLGERTQRFV